MKHVINVVIIIAVLTAILLFVVDNVNWMPVAASAESIGVDWLFGLHLDVIVFLYVMVNVILLYSVFVFRRRPGDVSEGAYFHSNSGLEILWTIIPLAVVLYFAYLGAGVLNQVTAASDDEMDVLVTGQQFIWTFEYPGLGQTPEENVVSLNELVLPVGQKIHLMLESNDVLHDFWVPEFRLKQDTVPGQTKHLRITPTEIGDYKVRCAELCGTGHAKMLADVRVVSAADFEIWRQQKLGIYVPPEGETQEPGEVDPVAEGQQLVQNNGCVACHSLDGTDLVGPTWLGLFGTTTTLEDGSTVTADEAYLTNSIINPGDQIVLGYQNLMPANYGDILSETEIGYIIEYLKTLQ